jgi:hypothetical protein
VNRHLLVCITPHGYGHTAQIAPVVNALRQQLPDLSLTLRTTVPHTLLAARFDPPFTHIKTASDFGMAMASAVTVLAEQSAAAYADFHTDWDRKVEQEAAELSALAPDLVLANVPYLPLAGAALADIPSAALCSLNWADIYQHYCGQRPEAGRILEQMHAAYNSAAVFLRPQPCMPMITLDNTRMIGPIARVGRDRRDEINRIMNLSGEETLVLVAPGGIPTRWPMEHWPRLRGVRWIVQSDWHVTHPDAVALESLGMPITDVMRSGVVLLGKPGYGSIAECVCNTTPMLYLMRHDWPEEPYLLEWLQQHGRGLAIDSHAVETGDLGAALEELLAQPAKPAVEPSGIQEAAEHLRSLLM